MLVAFLLSFLTLTPAEPAHLSASWPKPQVPRIIVEEQPSHIDKLRRQNRPYEPRELVEILVAAGFRNDALPIAFAVAMRESRGHRNAHNGEKATKDNSYGLFQINMDGDLGPDRRAKFNLESNEDLFDPIRNARIAWRMTDGGKDWSSWGIGPNSYREDLTHTLRPFLRMYPR